MMSAVLEYNRPQLRPMTVEDVARVVTIEREVYEFPWTEGIFRDCLNVGYCCWVYEADEDVVAYGLMSLGAGEAHVLNLCVHPDYQGQGLGYGLLDQLIRLAHRYRANTVFLEARPSNIPALKLYERMGFAEVGCRRAYYPARNGREDAIIMARELISELS